MADDNKRIKGNLKNKKHANVSFSATQNKKKKELEKRKLEREQERIEKERERLERIISDKVESAERKSRFILRRRKKTIPEVKKTSKLVEEDIIMEDASVIPTISLKEYKKEKKEKQKEEKSFWKIFASLFSSDENNDSKDNKRQSLKELREKQKEIALKNKEIELETKRLELEEKKKSVKEKQLEKKELEQRELELSRKHKELERLEKERIKKEEEIAKKEAKEREILAKEEAKREKEQEKASHALENKKIEKNDDAKKFKGIDLDKTEVLDLDDIKNLKDISEASKEILKNTPKKSAPIVMGDDKEKQEKLDKIRKDLIKKNEEDKKRILALAKKEEKDSKRKRREEAKRLKIEAKKKLLAEKEAKKLEEKLKKEKLLEEKKFEYERKKAEEKARKEEAKRQKELERQKNNIMDASSIKGLSTKGIVEEKKLERKRQKELKKAKELEERKKREERKKLEYKEKYEQKLIEKKEREDRRMVLLKEQQEKKKKIDKEKEQAREERREKARLIKKAKEESKQKTRQERKTLDEKLKNWYNNLAFVKDRQNRREMKRQTLLIDFEGADAIRSEEKIMYKYVAKYIETSKVEKGFFAAFSKLDVHSFLIAEGYEVYEITPQKNPVSSLSIFAPKFKAQELDFFLTQLSTFLKSGITLVDSVKILSKQSKKKAHKQVYKSIIYELTMGENFSEALSKQGTIFPRLLVNMIKTSELTGDLPETLDDMADYYRETEKTRKQMVSAMTYPLVVLTFAFVILIYIMVGVIPQFVSIYADLDSELPGITVAIINISNFLQSYWLYVVAGIIAFIIIFIILFKTIKVFKTVIQSLMMNIPIIGKIMIYNEVTMFTKTFASLLNHNVYITDCMEVLSKVTNNEVYKMLIFDTITNLAKGEAISNSFKNHWAFPNVAYEMILTGEKTGQLGNMMDKVAIYYQEQHKNAVNQIKAFIEPVMIVVLAAIVGVVLLSVILPMFDMYQNIG